MPSENFRTGYVRESEGKDPVGGLGERIASGLKDVDEKLAGAEQFRQDSRQDEMDAARNKNKDE